MESLLTKSLFEMSDEEVFGLLDLVSNEVKRRNNIIAPPISNVRNQTTSQNLEMVMEALAGLASSKNKK